jgi:uncharacterized protein involved in exopolysaccharide biosynthesis
MNLIDSGETVPLKTAEISHITAVLFRRKWLMLITFLLVFGGVTAGTLLMPKQYETHLKILVKNERADMVVTADSNSGSGYHGEVSETQINTEIELLNSENLLQQVVIKCGLERLEHSGASPESERLPVAIEKAVLRLQRDLKISPVRKADIIQIDYSAGEPRQAATVLRQLAESYLEAHLKVHATPGTYEFFTSQAARYQNELEEAETKLADFRRQNNIVMLAQQKEEMLQKAADAESALLQAEAAIREYTYKSADTRKQLAAASPRVVTQSRTATNQYSVEHLSSMLAELQNRRTQLLAKFRPDDRLVQEADQEISDTQAGLEKAMKLTGLEQSTDVNPVHQTLEIEMAKEQAELAGVEARRGTLAQQAQSYRQQLMKLGNATAEYDDLARNQKAAEENYLLYTKKTEEARIAESLDQQKIANVAIAETPTEPHLPSKPKVPLNLVLGLVLAGFLSLGIAVSTEYFREPLRPHVDMQTGMSAAFGGQHLLDTVENPSDLEELTGLTVLATTHRP